MTPPAPRTRPRAHILLVDDDRDLLRLLSIRLQASGYQVSTAECIQAACTLLGIERFDLVLSDVRLPDGDGLALFEDIRSQHPALPVILLTAHGTIPDAVEATSRGVADYLTKPFDSHTLMQRIEQALHLTAAAAPLATSDPAWRAGLISQSTLIVYFQHQWQGWGKQPEAAKFNASAN